MRWFVAALLFVFCAPLLSAQELGHEWIDYEKTYYRIPVAQDGIHKITYAQLRAAGFPAGTPTGKIQLFFRGKEQAIRLQTRGPLFGEGDFVEFYGRKNRGALDALMYRKPDFRPNHLQAIYSDSTYVFLTPDGTNGKRMKNIAAGSGTPITYYKEKIDRSFADMFSRGQQYPETEKRHQKGNFDSDWVSGKGYTGKVAWANSKNDLTLSVPDLYVNDFAAELKMTITGWSNTAHDIDILVGPSPANQRIVGKLRFKDFENGRISVRLRQSDFDLAQQKIHISYKLNSSDHQDRAAVSVVSLYYNRRLTPGAFGSRLFSLAVLPTDNLASFSVGKVQKSARLFDLTRPDVPQFIGGSVSDGLLTAGFSAARGVSALWLDAAPIAVKTVQKVTISRPKRGSDYLMVVGKQFTQGDNPAKAYADYRASAAGGQHRVDVQLFENLRNLFTYGEYTPLAIRRYADYMLDRTKSQFLFLVGKSLDPKFQYERHKNKAHFPMPESFPCWGTPCSDNLYSAGLRPDADPNVPEMATGRLSSINPVALRHYLNKVKTHEGLKKPQAWRKRALHLSGGKNQRQLTVFRYFVDYYKSVFEGKYLGGKVMTASKQSMADLEFIDVVEEVNRGLGLITFFGHSGIATTDITIGKVSSPVLGYKNKGKYPFMLINGCLSGNVYERNASTLGEDWINTPDKGAIGFIAHSDFGLSLTQNNYAVQFYQTHFQDSNNVYAPIGKVIKQLTGKHLKRYPSKIAASNTQQYVLQGDPAVRLFPINKPDYEISDKSLSVETFFGKKLSVLADSFRLAISVKNLGIVSDKKFDISVVRTFPDGTTKRYSPQFYEPVKHEKTLYFVVRNNVQEKAKSSGLNTFEVFVDYSRQIDELQEDNNYGKMEVVLPKGGVQILNPREFSIQNKQPVSVIIQNKNLKDKPRNYRFELDTTDLFNSPAKRESLVFGGLITAWSAPLFSDNAQDSTVYYLRCRYAEIAAEEDSSWSETSFIYLKDRPEGWSQSHFPQYKKNTLSKLVRDDESRQFSFLKEGNRLEVTAIGSGVNDQKRYKVTYNGSDLVSDGNCGNGRLLMIKFNRDTGLPYSEDYYLFDVSLSCGFGTPGAATWLYTQLVNSYNSIDRICNDSKTGDYILYLTAGYYGFDQMKASQWNAFARIGADVALMKKSVRSGEPFIILGKNGGAPGSAQMIFPDRTAGAKPAHAQTLTANFNIRINHVGGEMTSPPIGPALAWKNIHFDFAPKDAAGEQSDISIHVLDKHGNQGLILDKVARSGQDISFINSEIYPYLKLKLKLRDGLKNTPRLLKKWQVYYKESPEGALFYQAKQDANIANPDSIKISLGAETNFAFKFQNISAGNFEQPLIAQYKLTNLETKTTLTYYDTLGKLPAGDSILFKVKLPTKNMEGRNKLRVYVNPKIQVEQRYDNNLLEMQFEVRPDKTNPILDVVFDGIHIMDNDIVSPTPVITVSLKDENTFLIRKDTLGIDLFLAKCESCQFDDVVIGDKKSQFKRINFNDERISWRASKGNDFQIFFRPALSDGKYVLVARGKDLSGNSAGITPYSVRFRVINKSTISNFYPYPNPFSDKVRFVFTLTGRKIPSAFKIQIMTISGRVVREITQDEIGTLRAGNNITDYAWDGKDEFGDQLANGVYLYRVVMPEENNPFEHRKTAADHLFKNGFGKLYLLK